MSHTTSTSFAALLAGLLLLAAPANAVCSNHNPAPGETVTCNTDQPNPDPEGVSGGQGVNGVTVNVLPDAGIDGPNIAIDPAGAFDWTVNNSGSVSGGGVFSTGIRLFGGSISNQSGAEISGSLTAIDLFIAPAAGSATIFNAGVITGTGGVAIRTNAESESTESVDLILAGTSVLNGDVTFDFTASTNTLNLEGTNSEDSNFTGFGFINVASGAHWTLSGELTSSITETLADVVGTLRVNGLLEGAVEVQPSGRLEGIGAVGETTNDGTVAPGEGAIGTLTVSGGYLQTENGALEVDIEPSGSSDLLNITDSISTGVSGTVSVHLAPGPYVVGTEYTILTVPGGFGTGPIELVSDNPDVTLQLVSSAVGLLLRVVDVAQPELSFDPATLDFGDVELGTGETLPATLLNTGDADATNLGFTLSGEGFEGDTTGCGPTLPAGGSCEVDVTFSPNEIGPAEGSLTVEIAEGGAAALELAGNGVSKREIFSPVALEVDMEPVISDGNQVFEPGERVEVVPAWRNDGEFPQALTGTASDFTGPDGPDYTLVFDAADYGEVEPDEIASCQASELCYAMEIGPEGVPRPATHWDATFEEALSDKTVKTWTLHIGDSFADVPRASLFYRSIETLLHHGTSGDPSLERLQLPLLGCAETEFCPAASTTRAEAAVFLLKGLEGAAFDPPACASGSERFDDVRADDPFCPWIEELAARGVTAGCGGGNYCPDAAVTRAQMAVLLLKTLEGPGYVPPACTGVFDDVACPSLFADWIEDLFGRGITAGCEGDNYCPSQPTTRAQMAAFVVRTFGLVLYGP